MINVRSSIKSLGNFFNGRTSYLGKPEYWIFLTMLVFSFLFYTMAIANHYYYRTYTFDYGTYNYAFWDYAHLHISKCSIYKSGGSNLTFFQDHFSFVLMYLVPFYWLLHWLTGTYTLLILQTSLILLSGWFVYKLIFCKTHHHWLSLFALWMYFLIQGRYSAFLDDVNIGIFSACLVPIFLYYFEKGRYLISSIIFAMALFSRENMSIWFVFICIVMIFWYRKDSKRLKICCLYILFSILFFILLLKLFIPLVESKDKAYGLFTFTALGKNLGDAMKFIILHPVSTFTLLYVNHSGNDIFDGVKLEFYLVYLVSGGFLLFYRPHYLIWFIPILAFKMFNDSPVRWSIESYYSVDVVTLMSISLALIIHEINLKIIRTVTMILVLFLAAGVTIRMSEAKNHRMSFFDTTKEYIFHAGFFHSQYDLNLINRSLQSIPSNASLSASDELLSHLSERDTIYFFPYTGDASYVAIFEDHGNYLISRKDYQNSVNKILNDPDWTIIVHQSSLIIAKRNKHSDRRLNRTVEY